MSAATPGGLSPASSDLGLGSMLSSQVAGETAEQRKKRMAQMASQTPAQAGLFGSTGGLGGLGT